MESAHQGLFDLEMIICGFELPKYKDKIGLNTIRVEFDHIAEEMLSIISKTCKENPNRQIYAEFYNGGLFNALDSIYIKHLSMHTGTFALEGITGWSVNFELYKQEVLEYLSLWYQSLVDERNKYCQSQAPYPLLTNTFLSFMWNPHIAKMEPGLQLASHSVCSNTPGHF